MVKHILPGKHYGEEQGPQGPTPGQFQPVTKDNWMEIFSKGIPMRTITIPDEVLLFFDQVKLNYRIEGIDETCFNIQVLKIKDFKMEYTYTINEEGRNNAWTIIARAIALQVGRDEWHVIERLIKEGNNLQEI